MLTDKCILILIVIIAKCEPKSYTKYRQLHSRNVDTHQQRIVHLQNNINYTDEGYSDGVNSYGGLANYHNHRYDQENLHSGHHDQNVAKDLAAHLSLKHHQENYHHPQNSVSDDTEDGQNLDDIWKILAKVKWKVAKVSLGAKVLFLLAPMIFLLPIISGLFLMSVPTVPLIYILEKLIRGNNSMLMPTVTPSPTSMTTEQMTTMMSTMGSMKPDSTTMSSDSASSSTSEMSTTPPSSMSSTMSAPMAETSTSDSTTAASDPNGSSRNDESPFDTKNHYHFHSASKDKSKHEHTFSGRPPELPLIFLNNTYDDVHVRNNANKRHSKLKLKT